MIEIDEDFDFKSRTMLVYLDKQGTCLPDVEIEEYVDKKLEFYEDFHVSQMLIIDCLRSKLTQIPIDKRPQIVWNFYGKEVHYNEYMASINAYEDERTVMNVHFSETILRTAMKMKKEKDVRNPKILT